MPRVVPPDSQPDDPSYDAVTRMLNSTIRALHTAVGNVDPREYTLVIGSGGVQLIDAAFYALTQGPNANRSMHVFAQAPAYPHFQQTAGLNPLTQWVADPKAAGVSPVDLIEVVTSPNNPDGKPTVPRYPAAAQVTDYVYRWPHYAPATAGARSDALMIFSHSKLTGFAASRIGWALVRDPAVAATMSKYMFLQSTAPAVEAQLRAIRSLRAIVAAVGTPDDFFTFARSRLAARWEALHAAFSNQTRFAIEGQDGVLFLWLRCTQAGDAANCAAPFATVGIATETGEAYGSDTAHVRICMGHDDSTFALLLHRIRTLVAASTSQEPTVMKLVEEPSGLTEASDRVPLWAVDRLRAETRIPRAAYRGSSFGSMSRMLNAALGKYASVGLTTAPCTDFNVAQLHALQTQLLAAAHPELQEVYRTGNDSRALAFGDPARPQPEKDAEERRLAAAHPESRALIRDALCHRLVMQYVHHLTAAQRASLPSFTLPRLPGALRSPGPAETVVQAAAGTADGTRMRRDGEASVTGTPQALLQSRAIYADATKCIVCHITSNTTAFNAATALPPRPTIIPGSQTARVPHVPLWPEEFDVAFGLTTGAGARNVSSHLYFSSILPGMRIHHDECDGMAGFLPQLPIVKGGACNFTFHANGLWFSWPTAKAGEPDQCCSVVHDNLLANLGLNETDGFDFGGYTRVANLANESVAAEVWTISQRLQPPAGITIYISPTTGEDVHYRDGGAFELEWALAPRAVRSQLPSTFELPSNPTCERPCSAAARAGTPLHPLHVHLAAQMARIPRRQRTP